MDTSENNYILLAKRLNFLKVTNTLIIKTRIHLETNVFALRKYGILENHTFLITRKGEKYRLRLI